MLLHPLTDPVPPPLAARGRATLRRWPGAGRAVGLLVPAAPVPVGSLPSLVCAPALPTASYVRLSLMMLRSSLGP